MKNMTRLKQENKENDFNQLNLHDDNYDVIANDKLARISYKDPDHNHYFDYGVFPSPKYQEKYGT